MKQYQILLIDQDPDEHFLIETALNDIPLSVACTYCADAREAIQRIAKSENVPDFILFSIPYPTRQDDMLMAELNRAVQGTSCEVLIYGLDKRLFFNLMRRHQCNFLSKCFSLDQLRQRLVDLLTRPGVAPVSQLG